MLNSWRRSFLRTASLLLTCVLFLAACGSADRPTVTDERLVLDAPEAAAQPESAAPAEAAPPTATALLDDPTESATEPEDAPETEPAAVEFMVVEILEQFPHDETAFTQGLELRDGLFVESTGLYGESTVRRVDPTTGEVLQSVSIEDQYFAEGLTQVGDELVQITWRENTAFFWDAETLTRTREVAYDGEGWGICFDGERLVMTDGTPTLIFRDPASFEELGRVAVTFNGQELANLNEVECVNGDVWANVWLSNEIVRIDPTTGNVTGHVNAFGLNPPTEPNGAVLNGIAWDETTQSFFVTGKLWPTMYRVNFVPAG